MMAQGGGVAMALPKPPSLFDHIGTTSSALATPPTVSPDERETTILSLVAPGPRLDDEDTHPLAIKVHGLLSSDPTLRTMKNDAQEKSAASTEESENLVWLRARAERMRRLVAGAIPNIEDKLRSITLERSTDGSFGVQIASTENGGHLITRVQADGPAAGIARESDYILVVNQKLGFDYTLEELVSAVSESKRLNMTVVHFDSDEDIEGSQQRAVLHRNRRKSLAMEMLLVKRAGEPCGLSFTTVQAKGQLTTAVTNIVPGGVADRAGIRVGDVIRSVNGFGTKSLSHSGILSQMSLSSVELEIERDPALRPVSVINAPKPQPTLASTKDGRGSAVTLRKRDPREKPLPRQNTVYLQDFSIPKSMPLLKRMRGKGGTSQQSLPSSFAVPTLSKDDAALILTGRTNGSYLFREARGVVALSLVHNGEVHHYTLQISLRSSYKDVDKALRKFVKYYSNKRASKGALPCALSQYIIDVPFEIDGQSEEEDAFSDGEEGETESGPYSFGEGKRSFLERKITARRMELTKDANAMGESSVDIVVDHPKVLDEDGLPVSPKYGHVDEDGLPVDSEREQVSALTSPASSSESVKTVELDKMFEKALSAKAAAKAREAANGQEQEMDIKDPEISEETSKKTEPEAPQGAPRRRKLVRGGNTKETPVLPEFAEAMKALDDLDSFLNVYEEMHHDLESLDGPQIETPSKNFFSFSTLSRSRQGFASLPPVPNGGSTHSLISQSDGYMPNTHTAKQPYSLMMDTLF